MLLLLLALACHPTSDDTGGGTDTDSGGDPAIDTANCEDMDEEVGQAGAPGCSGAGGVCLGDPDGCVGGTLQPEFDSECLFDDGPGYCCVPPEPEADGDSCASSGGVCAPVGGCGKTQGWHTPYGTECSDQEGPNSICCAPHDACEGWGVVSCCSEDQTAAYMTQCDHGELTCMEGTVLECDDDCAAFD